jgi:hypothetical protein
VIFYKAGEMEGRSGLLWCLISFLAWIATPQFLPSRLLSKILGQVALFFGIALFRMFWEDFRKKR